MANQIFANLGRGAADGTTATNPLLAGGGDNPLIIGGLSGWTFSAADRSIDGPSDGHGFRRTTAGGAASYLRAAWAPVGSRNGARAWVYIPGTPAVDWDVLRLVNASEQAMGNIRLRTNRTMGYAPLNGAVVIGSLSPVLAAGWYCIEALIDFAINRAYFRLLDATGTQIHSWEGPSGATATVAGFRVGEPASNAHGFTTMRIGSRVTWGSLDSGWFPNDATPWVDVEPPPTTTAVSHYNTAEGLTIGDPVTAGVGTGPDGVKFSLRGGTAGATVEVSGTPIKGSRSYVVKAGGGQAYLQWGVSTNTVAARMHLKLPELPSAATRFMVLRNASEEPVAGLYILANGTVQVQAGRPGAVIARTLPGVVDAGRAIRVEMWGDARSNKVHAAWGYIESGNEGEAVVDTQLGGQLFSSTQFGKLLSSAWASNFLIDDLAVNHKAEAFVGGWASSYTLLAILAGDIADVEPGTDFTLEVLSGTGTWAQAAGPTTPVTVSGSKATGRAPYTVEGATLRYSYGGSVQSVTVLPAAERVMTGSGEKAARLEVV